MEKSFGQVPDPRIDQEPSIPALDSSLAGVLDADIKKGFSDMIGLPVQINTTLEGLAAANSDNDSYVAEQMTAMIDHLQNNDSALSDSGASESHRAGATTRILSVFDQLTAYPDQMEAFLGSSVVMASSAITERLDSILRRARGKNIDLEMATCLLEFARSQSGDSRGFDEFDGWIQNKARTTASRPALPTTIVSPHKAKTPAKPIPRVKEIGLKGILPFDELAETVQAKLASLGEYEHADSTSEFNRLSTELFGGNIFGENAIVTVRNTQDGPLLTFSDRMLEERTAPIQVAHLNAEGLHIRHPVILADWLAQRGITEGGEFTFRGLREAVDNSPLRPNISDVEFEALVAQVGTARLRPSAGHKDLIGLGLDLTTPEQIGHKKMQLARVAALLAGLPGGADIAEILTTENNRKKSVPHVLRTPSAWDVLSRLESEFTTTREIECREDGALALVMDLGFLGIRSEQFFAHPMGHRDRAAESLENASMGTTGPRSFTAVGPAFTMNEKTMLASIGRGVEGAWGGGMYAQPYQIEASNLPHGTVVKYQDTKNGAYRVFLPTAP